MALASLDIVKKRIIQILNANPTAYANTVSGDVGAFPHDAEISDAIFQAEQMIVSEGYFNSVNQSLGANFAVVSGSLSSGDLAPEIRGSAFIVEVSQNGSAWEKAEEAAHIDDVVNISRHAAYIEPFAGKYLYKFDGGRFYTGAMFGRIKSLNYTRTGALQIFQAEEFLLIATTIRVLAKHASPATFENYKAESARGINALAQDGIYKQQMEANV